MYKNPSENQQILEELPKISALTVFTRRTAVSPKETRSKNPRLTEVAGDWFKEGLRVIFQPLPGAVGIACRADGADGF